MVNFWFYIVSGEKIWEHFCVLLGMMYHQVWANVLCWMSTVSIHNLNIFTLFAYRFLNLKGTNLFEELTLVHWIILQLALFLFWKKTQRDHPFKTSANFHDFWPLPPTIGIPAKCLWRGFLILVYCDLWPLAHGDTPPPPWQADVLNGWSLL